MPLVQIQHRFDTAANWSAANPVLLAGELGLDTTSGRWKAGDGTTAWNSLAFQHSRILTGTGAPGGGLGVDGDLYINTAEPRLFGPKAAGAWGSGTTMVGPQGIQGIQGNPGANGQGVPTGGTTGQYLRKTSGTDYATAFATIPSAEVSGLGALATVSNLTGPITSTGAATAVTADAITNVMLSNMVAGTLKGTIAGGDPADLTAAQVTSMLDQATTTTKGLMSALDKRIVDNLHYDFVADWGGVGDDSTLNDTQIANAIAGMPLGSTLFFPAGTYRFANEININVDKRFSFRGVSRYTSIIKTTSATNNLFHKSVAGWYDSWSDLGFASSVTKTAGAAIRVSAGNNVGMNVYRIAATGMFKTIEYIGNQSGNLSVLADMDINGLPNGGRGIHINGATINIMLHNITINAGAATTSACCEINASGAVQVTGCDWIMGTNVVLMNAASALGAQACYFTNCFFDQPQADVILVNGGFTTNRIKFTQCGIATSGSAANGIHINGTGAGAVGTATSHPAGISIVDCDIYHQAGNGTGAGIRINGAQDVNIANTRITGYGGTGGAGIHATPTAALELRANGCIIGPNSNLTVTNATGVHIAAGTMARISVSDNTIKGYTVASVTNLATVANPSLNVNINDNDGMLRRGNANLSFADQAIAAATATYLTGSAIPVPLNGLRVGTILRWRVTGNTTAAAGTAANSILIKTGTGVVGDATHATLTTLVGTAATGIAFSFTVDMIVSAVGATANSRSSAIVTNTGVTGFINQAGNVIQVGAGTAFNSTGALTIGLALTTGASKTVTITSVNAEVINP